MLGTTEVVTSTTIAIGFNSSTMVGLITNNGIITIGATGTIIHTHELFRFSSATGETVDTYLQGNSIFLTLQDSNRNLLGAATETISIIITTGDPTAEGDRETITLEETSVNSGIFRNTSTLLLASTFSPTQNNGTLTYRVSGTMSSNYIDNRDSTNNTTSTKNFSVTTATAPDTGGGTGGAGGGGGGGGGSVTAPAQLSLFQ